MSQTRSTAAGGRRSAARKGASTSRADAELARLVTDMAQRLDGWANILTGMGRLERDKRVSTVIDVAPVFSSPEELDELFAGDDLAAKIVELPATSMTREWVDVRVGDDSEAGKKMAQALEDLDAQPTWAEALTWAPTYGGALILLGVRDRGGKPERPVDERRIESVDWLRVIDRFDVRVARRYSDPKHPKFGKPELYEFVREVDRAAIHASTTSRPSDLQLRPGTMFHETRTVRLEGPLTPKRRRDQLNDGWPDSVFVRVYEVVRDFAAAWGGSGNLVTDFAQAVLKIKGLAKMLNSDSAAGTSAVLARIRALDMSRSVGRVVPLDADGEDFQRVTTPLAGLADLLDRFAKRLGSAADMPVTVLMGESPAGLQATGSIELRNWYDVLRGRQVRVLVPTLGVLVRYLFLARRGPTRGKEPKEWSIEPRPLWQLDDKTFAEVYLNMAEADSRYIELGVLDPSEVALSRFGGDRYSLQTQIDVALREKLKGAALLEPVPPPDPADEGDEGDGGDDGGEDDDDAEPTGDPAEDPAGDDE